MKIKTLLAHIEKEIVPTISESWDRNGLIVGDETQETDSVLLASDLTNSALIEAERVGAKLIITHHPPLFPSTRGIRDLRVSHAKNEPALVALLQGVAVASYHTSYDRCSLYGLGKLASLLGVSLPEGRFLSPEEKYLKLVVFVPKTHFSRVQQALFNAGAGVVGQYGDASFSVAGLGSFKGSSQSRPKLGKRGKRETVKEERLEMILPEVLRSHVDSALLSNHPYEEVARDYYEVKNLVTQVGWFPFAGYGFYGNLPKPVSSEIFQQVLFKSFRLNACLKSGNLPAKVSRIGFSPGKGDSFLRGAIAVGCDVFITGETGYHPARQAYQQGLCTLELGHTQSELPFFWSLEKLIGRAAKTHVFRENFQSFV